jgi:hypothetical protein
VVKESARRSKPAALPRFEDKSQLDPAGGRLCMDLQRGGETSSGAL